MTQSMDAKVVSWLCDGEVGVSSKALMRALVYGESLGDDYPLDPSDFERCRKMISFLGLKSELIEFRDKIKFPTTAWHYIIKNWINISFEIDEEKHTGRCPKAYKTMQNLIDGARK